MKHRRAADCCEFSHKKAHKAQKICVRISASVLLLWHSGRDRIYWFDNAGQRETSQRESDKKTEKLTGRISETEVVPVPVWQQRGDANDERDPNNEEYTLCISHRPQVKQQGREE